MDSDSDCYYEDVSENEQEVAGPLHINVQVNLEESQESPQSGSPSPLLPPQQIPVSELLPVWELPDKRRDNFYEFFYKSRCARPKAMVGINPKKKK